MKRSGILMHISSLPSKYGIGSFGKEAYKFVDFLYQSKSSIWQVLPMGQTGYGDSPYQSVSSFAGNPYFIDLDILTKEGFLQTKDLPKKQKENAIDYANLYKTRYNTLQKSFNFAYEKVESEVEEFKKEQCWLLDYALYMSIKKKENFNSWLDWSDELAKNHDETRLAELQEELGDDVKFYCYIQYLFFKQWNSLKKYANEKGIKICGDLPIYCALDSADVWGNYQNFQLSDKKVPLAVAGVPPDYFSADGQLWGNPLYDWEYIKETNYTFWIDRIKGSASLFDMVRLDHFIGFVNYYSIEYGAENARNGEWKQGPGLALFEKIKEAVPNLEIIAEDLGVLTEEVISLKEDAGFAGMHILMFMLSTAEEDGKKVLKMQKFSKKSIAYTGTHDNDTTLSWWNSLSKEDKAVFLEGLGFSSDKNIVRKMIKVCFGSKSETVIIPITDYLSVGGEGRMNTPGKTEGNWVYQIKKGELTQLLAKEIAKLNKKYNR